LYVSARYPSVRQLTQPRDQMAAQRDGRRAKASRSEQAIDIRLF